MVLYYLDMEEINVRRAIVADAAGMAWVHVRSWRETYRGLVADDVLDRPDAADQRERWWVRAIAEGAVGTSAVAVAERDDEIIGIASAGAPRDDDATWPVELFVLYLLADFHGSGAGRGLLDAVIGDSPAALWVADPNPRAQAFYRKCGFIANGNTRNDGIPEIRMVRPATPSGS